MIVGLSNGEKTPPLNPSLIQEPFTKKPVAEKPKEDTTNLDMLVILHWNGKNLASSVGSSRAKGQLPLTGCELGFLNIPKSPSAQKAVHIEDLLFYRGVLTPVERTNVFAYLKQ